MNNYSKDKKTKSIKYEKINGLVFPEVLKPVLSTFNDKMLASFEKDGPPIDKDISLGKLNKEEEFVYTMFLWYAEVDGIIVNLNMILNDIALLGEDHKQFLGSPKTRFYLLIRAFFYEFYRVREVFAQVLFVFKQQKRLDKESINSARKMFHEAFSEMHELRNNMVHGSTNWKGQEHYELRLLSMVQEKGQALADRTTGEVWDIQPVLYKLCQKNISVLAAEGARVRHVMQTVIDGAVSTLKDQPE